MKFVFLQSYTSLHCTITWVLLSYFLMRYWWYLFCTRPRCWVRFWSC